MSEEIVVTGYRTQDSGTMWYNVGDVYHSLIYSASSDSWIDGPISSSPPAGTDDPAVEADSVKVKVTNPDNLEEALQAAANILEQLNEIRSHLSSLSPETSVTFNGETMTAVELLTFINGIEFSVVDTSAGNGGVGAANWSESGDHTVDFYFEAFDGDGENDYAHPNYENNEALTGIIFHELGHLTDSGHEFYEDSYMWFSMQRAETGESWAEFTDNSYGYWDNLQANANDFAQSLAGSFGFDINTWIPIEGFIWMAPNIIYNMNMSEGDVMSAPTATGLDSTAFDDPTSGIQAVSSDWMFA